MGRMFWPDKLPPLVTRCGLLLEHVAPTVTGWCEDRPNILQS